MATTIRKGTVTAFDRSTGRGKVEISGGTTLRFGATSFRSGRPARYPAKGDAVQVVVPTEGGSPISVRLVRAKASKVVR